MANKLNREHKSTLFSYMFSQKEYALQLYNALNNTNYDNPEDIQIPTPKCIVLYNGTKEQPDQMEIRLSDAFINQSTKGDLELTVLMLNINFNHNKELLKKCEVLYAYSLYISKFREYNENTKLSLEEAAVKALDYCISENVMADFFKERRNEVVGMILEEYTKERVEQDMANMAQEIEDMKQEISEKDAEIARLRQALAERENC